MTSIEKLVAVESDSGGFGGRFLAPLMLGSALNPVNSSLIATALIPIGQAFGVSGGRTAVLIAALYVASAIAQPTMGRLAEQFGARRIFLLGAALVLVGGILGASATTLNMVVIARVLIGVGTSASFPTSMMLIRRNAETASPGEALGWLSITGQVTVVLGLPLGGVLVGVAGWRSTFLINVPFALAALIMALAWLPRDRPRPSHRGLRALSRELDVIGIALFASALTSLMVFLLALQQPRWSVLLVSLTITIVLILRELRVTAPFFDVRSLVANRALTLTYVRTATTMFGTYCVMYGVTQWLQDGKGLSASVTGLVVLPMTAVAAIISRPVSRRNLVRTPLIVSAVASLLVAVALRFMGTDTAIAAIVGATLVLGLTVGLGGIGNQAALYSQSGEDEMGTTAGLQRTATYLGAIASSAVISVVYAHGVTDTGLHVIASILMAVGLFVLVLTLVDRSIPRVITHAA